MSVPKSAVDPEMKNPADEEQRSEKDNRVPYERFKEVNDKLQAALSAAKELEEYRKKREAEDQQAAEERLKQQGQYEELLKKQAADNEALKQKVEQLKAFSEKLSSTFKAGVNEMLKALPEALKPLYIYGEDPQGEELIKAYEWLQKAVKTAAPTERKREGGNPPNPENTVDRKKIAEDAKRRALERYRVG